MNISRRSLIHGSSAVMFGGISGRRPDQRIPVGQQGMLPAGSGVIVARRVIVIGPDDGLFVYNGSVGPGNLQSSDAAMAGTDEAGNAYLAGPTAYVFNSFLSIWTAIQQGALNIGVVGNFAASSFWTSPGTATSMPGPWTQHGGMAGGNNFAALEFPQGSGNFASVEVQAAACSVNGVPLTATAGTAANPTVIQTDTAHGLGAPSGLTGVSGQGVYFLTPNNELGLCIQVSFNAPGAVTTASFANSLPAAYQPPANRIAVGNPVRVVAAVPGTGTGLFISGSGVVEMVNIPAAATAIGCDVRIPLF